MTSVWTIGHSTRPLDEFLALLAAYDIEAVADVRRYAGSRRWPYFAHDAIRVALGTGGMDYVWLPELGGRRRPRPDSPNTAWRSAQFRGYADYMATGPFADGLVALMNLALGLRTAIMCAEAVWWRCHSHPYTKAARIVAGRLAYMEAPG